MSTIITDQKVFETSPINEEFCVDFIYAVLILGTLMCLAYAAMVDGLMGLGMAMIAVSVWGLGTIGWERLQERYR